MLLLTKSAYELVWCTHCCSCHYSDGDLDGLNMLFLNEDDDETTVMPRAGWEMFSCFTKVATLSSSALRCCSPPPLPPLLPFPGHHASVGALHDHKLQQFCTKASPTKVPCLTVTWTMYMQHLDRANSWLN